MLSIVEFYSINEEKYNLFIASHTKRNKGNIHCISVAIFVRLPAV
jgi:hypothetical protein